MDIPESDHAKINKALLELDIFYRPNDKFTPDIVEKVRAIINESCNLPEWQAEKNYMDAGMAAVVMYLKQTYPWLTEHAIQAVRHACMMYMK